MIYIYMTKTIYIVIIQYIYTVFCCTGELLELATR